jgi:hypothetical protein
MPPEVTPATASGAVVTNIDPDVVDVACHLAHCKPEDLLAVAERDNTLVVVVQPGPKHVFTAQQVADAVKEIHVPARASSRGELHQHQPDPSDGAGAGRAGKPPKPRKAG